MPRRYAIYDVFSDQALAGNPLAVVCGSDGLDDSSMQAIAREFNLSETTFPLAPTGDGEGGDTASAIRRIDPALRHQLQALRATDAELQAHEARLDALEKSAGFAFWRGAPDQQS